MLITLVWGKGNDWGNPVLISYHVDNFIEVLLEKSALTKRLASRPSDVILGHVVGKMTVCQRGFYENPLPVFVCFLSQNLP